ncbi:hypothetical protein [Mesorhizobium sophorae]|uniref:hypothetical protein n=1 Tax=Mesorhizobium sophorae TaxID=1300294 RepID=UPI001FDA1FFD|nr:hypothetical protein [Mesorhizobium sophorae]
MTVACSNLPKSQPCNVCSTCRRREAHPESAEARELALTLLALHNAGMVEEDMLMKAVGFRRLEPKSA